MPTVRTQAGWPRGSIIALEHRSSVLRSNPWGDPADRTVHVYLPASYDTSAPPFLTLWDLAAFTNSGPGHLNWVGHGENLAQRLDRLIGQGSMPPVIVVMPDCYTSLGGNQYLNSAAVGRYADYLVAELVPLVSQRFNAVNHRDGRGLFGKSSGGYGALFHAMNFGETWGAAASHAGDVGFDLVYRPAFPDACAELERHDRDPERFLRAFWASRRPTAREYSTLMVLAMAASYDPDPEQPAKIRLPFDLDTCELDEQRWSYWLAHDPLQMVESSADALRRLHALYLDVGRADEYHIQHGTRALTRRLEQLRIPFRCEEFDGTHAGLDWRLDHSLPFLAHALKKACPAAS